MTDVTRLFPGPHEPLALEGLYLAHDLQRAGSEQPVVYTNFISSLDGRISEPVEGSRQRRVPAAIANDRDWRLYMELAAQADICLTTTRHLRAVAKGRLSGLVEIDPHAYPDLARWRAERRLPPQPAAAVMSSQLDIPVRAVMARLQRPLVVITTTGSPVERIEALRAEGAQVVVTENSARVDGQTLVNELVARGHRRIYSVAGPAVLHTLLSAGVLSRLYLTLAQVMLGGSHYDTLTRGPALEPPAGFKLRELYLDTHGPAGAGQLFSVFDAAA